MLTAYTKSFLPPQGDIESVAQMNPKELTSLFEAVSGSEDLRKDYDEAQAAMAAADERAALLSGRRKLLNAEKRQKKEQKTEAEKHQAQLEQLVRLEHSFPRNAACMHLCVDAQHEMVAGSLASTC